MIAGELEPDEGNVKLGKTVKIGFVTQSRQELNEEDTIARAIVPDLVPVRVSDVLIQVNGLVQCKRLSLTFPPPSPLGVPGAPLRRPVQLPWQRAGQAREVLEWRRTQPSASGQDASTWLQPSADG